MFPDVKTLPQNPQKQKTQKHKDLAMVLRPTVFRIIFRTFKTLYKVAFNLETTLLMLPEPYIQNIEHKGGT